jgi:hypothetical protein
MIRGYTTRLISNRGTSYLGCISQGDETAPNLSMSQQCIFSGMIYSSGEVENGTGITLTPRRHVFTPTSHLETAVIAANTE